MAGDSKQARLFFCLMVILLIDHLAVPGYLKSWSNQKGIVLARSLIQKKSTSQEVSEKRACREPQTDYDRILQSLGVQCL